MGLRAKKGHGTSLLCLARRNKNQEHVEKVRGVLEDLCDISVGVHDGWP
jgi:hypothetical protein